MNEYRNNGTNINEAERAAFKQALTAYYTGEGRIVDVFAEAEAGLIDRYYRRKKKYPDEIEEIDREARDAAQKERSFERLGFEARQERLSWEMQGTARDYALALIPELERIARGEPRYVEIMDGDGNITRKTIIPYPRDQIAAFKVLQDAARYGVLPKQYWAKSSPGEKAEKEEYSGGLMPLFSTPTEFTEISGTAPDGTPIRVTMDDIKDVIAELDGDGDSE